MFTTGNYASRRKQHYVGSGGNTCSSKVTGNAWAAPGASFGGAGLSYYAT
ncbi:hypothetical protein HY993_03165 [Candidatus Micrarchaeota archaeon]|nr:hypothetical protein [Candidatus Micrarchaeota archaeon]